LPLSDRRWPTSGGANFVEFLIIAFANPFCLYLSHKAVHHDWKPPAHLKGRYKDADLSHLAPESDKYNTWTDLNWLEGTMGNMHAVYKRYHECLAAVMNRWGALWMFSNKAACWTTP